MRILCVANIRLPTEKAHGIQVMKACEAFVNSGQEVLLLVPKRRTHIKTEPHAYYGIKKQFPIRRLFTLDTVSFGTLGFVLQSISFGVAAALYVRRRHCDVVYYRDEWALFVFMLLGARRTIWESHDGAWNLPARFVAKRVRGLVVVTNGAKEFYLSRGIPEEKIHVTPNGIDLAEFAHPESKEVARTRLGLPREVKIAMYVGRLDGWKGTNTLLEASQLLPSDVRVVIIGGEEKQIEQLRQAYPNVIFLGFRPYTELSHNQAAADVLVVPNTGKDPVSVRFTSPLKLIAHMASGRPIVTSDLPSIRELVSDAEALLVEPDNPMALAEGILRALNSTVGTPLAEAAKARVEELDWSARAEGIFEFVKRVFDMPTRG